MRAFVSALALSFDGHQYLVADLVLVALRSGSWGWLEEQARMGCAAKQLAEDRGDPVDRNELQNVGALFRQARGLFSGEDFRAWLKARDLVADDWLAWLERSVLAARYAAERDELLKRAGPADEELGEVLRVDALCSGALRAAAETLLAHAAASGERDPGLEPPDISADAAAALGDPLLGLDGLPDLDVRLAHLARLRAAAAELDRELASSEQLDRVLLAHRLDWAAVTWAELALPGEGAAREAAMMVREDGLALDEVAAMLGLALPERAESVDGVGPELQPLLANAAAGDLLGPVETGAGWRLLLVRERVMPSRDEPWARERALDELRAAVVARRLAGRVTWHVEL
jgi:hypothetical protein